MTISRCEGMRVKEFIASGIGALLILSCSPPSSDGKAVNQSAEQTLEDRDQALCHASVLKNLLNPETAQFFEFSPIRETDPSYRPSILAELGNRDIRQYRLRYKAESRVGLKVTSINNCVVSKPKSRPEDYCICVEQS